MKLKHYQPTGHNVVVEEYKEEIKQGSLFLAPEANSMPMGKVLAVGTLCEGIKEGDIIVVDRMAFSNQIPLFFEDHPGVAATINQHYILGVFSE